MQKFLLSWKHKLGAILLVPLAIFFCSWIRSHFAQDEYEIRFDRFDSLVLSNTPRGIHVHTLHVDVGPDGPIGVGGTSFTIIYAFLLMPLIIACAYLLFSKTRTSANPNPSPEISK